MEVSSSSEVSMYEIRFSAVSTLGKLTISRERKVGFHVLTAAIMKTTVSWNTAPCSLVIADRRFRVPGPLITVMMEAVSISETS
jgi:hypothetical protein